jgi:molybdopterin synthase catalytic subunit
MAEKLLSEMAQEAATRFGCHAICFAHSFGPVQPGAASVVIQVATPHRSESFEACRYLIDRLKHELPIWKHEYWEQGRTIVKGCCAHHESDRTLVTEK